MNLRVFIYIIYILIIYIIYFIYIFIIYIIRNKILYYIYYIILYIFIIFLLYILYTCYLYIIYIYHFPFHLPDFPLNRRHFLAQHQFHLDYRQVKFLRHYDFRLILNKLFNSMMHSIYNQLLIGYPHFPHENHLFHIVHQKIKDSRLILKKRHHIEKSILIWKHLMNLRMHSIANHNLLMDSIGNHYLLMDYPPVQ